MLVGNMSQEDQIPWYNESTVQKACDCKYDILEAVDVLRGHKPQQNATVSKADAKIRVASARRLMKGGLLS